MVWSREKVEERPPPSVILPRLYLGAESDVTQEQLACLGISYVLTVSRCSPQPSFLPCSRYLRIPIDDSLWDDLLPWIPQALHFIDAAMSSGASVLVHCAAGISRSPTLAVAYVMYSLGMDLDHAYRFVKERRPSISPNFNFLGQLQHFQDILSQKASSGHLLAQQINTFPPSASDDITHIQTSQKMNHEAAGFSSIATEDKRDHKDTVNHTDKIQQRHIHSGRNKNQPLQTPHLTLCQIQKQVRTASKVSAPRPQEPSKHLTKLTQIRVPSGSASLLEKRKNLTLSLTPLGISSSCTSGRQQAEDATLPRMFQNSRSVRRPEAETPRPGDTHQEQSPSHNNCRDEVQSQGMLSPFSLTLNKLLGWGERVLLGGVFVHPVRIGQSALP